MNIAYPVVTVTDQQIRRPVNVPADGVDTANVPFQQHRIAVLLAPDEHGSVAVADGQSSARHLNERHAG